MSNEYVLEDERIVAAFDRTNGALRELLFKETGWCIQRRAALSQSFGLLVPVPGKRNHRVLGCRQRLADAKFDASGRTLELSWNRVESETGTRLDIGFAASITLLDGSLEFSAVLDNRTEHVVEACIWPWLGDLSRPAGSSDFYHLHFAYGDAVNESLYPRFANHRGCFGVDRPMQLSNTPATPFVLAHNGSEGLYIGYHDTTAKHLIQFRFELFPGFEFLEGFEAGTVPREDTLGGAPVHLESAVVHFPFAGRGEAGLQKVVLAPYRGSWHRGVDVYKAWRKSWYAPPEKPAWLREVHSWQQLHVNSPEEEFATPYRALPEIGEECAAHGVASIQLTGWASGGQDRNNPSHDIEPGLGTWEELRDAIGKIEAMGVHVVLFSKFTWADRSTERYRKELKAFSMMDPHGDPYYYPGYMYMTETQLADINTRRFIPMCMNCKGWLEVAKEEFGKVLALGASGTLYDECQHHGGANYCFDPGHGHAVPAHVFAGDAGLAELFHGAMKESNEDFVLCGEDCFDLQLRHYHLMYFRIGAGHLPVRRYMAPDAEMMVAVLGYNNRTVINQALLYRYLLSYEPRNFKGRLSEIPLTLEYGKRVDALRKRYRDYLWEAEFRDTLGAEVSIIQGPSTVRHTVFVSHAHGRRAVVLVNQGYDAPVRVQVRLEGGGTGLLVATPEQPAAVAFENELVLEAVSAAVILEQ